MPTYTRVLLHTQGPALWPLRKPLSEVMDVKATTPPHIWTATYQGIPTAPGGTVFKRAWWNGKNRYEADTSRPEGARIARSIIRRWISWDTAGSLAPEAAFTAGIVFEMTPDYRVLVREVVRGRYAFPDLVQQVEDLAIKYQADGKTAAVVIEKKSTGQPVFDTMVANSPPWLAAMLWLFDPTQDKVARAYQSSTWCGKDCVLLPHPSERVPWLNDFETEFFDYPASAAADQIDAFSQGIFAISHHIETGWRARLAWEAEQSEMAMAQAAGILPAAGRLLGPGGVTHFPGGATGGRVN